MDIATLHVGHSYSTYQVSLPDVLGIAIQETEHATFSTHIAKKRNKNADLPSMASYFFVSKRYACHKNMGKRNNLIRNILKSEQSFHNPFFNIPCFLTKVYPNLEKLTGIGCKRQSVVLLINLLQCFLRCAIQFKLHYINKFIRLQNKVNAPLTGMVFRFYVETYQFENDKKYILIM